MAARDTLDQLKSQLERLRHDSLDVVAKASRIVFEGVQKLAEQELKALNDYYKSATAGLRIKGGPSASQQLDLLQDTVQKVISHARESLSILSDTRAELARLVGPGDPATASKALSKLATPAKKAMEDVKKAASMAQKSAAKAAQDVKKSLGKTPAPAEKKGRAAVKNRVGSVLDVTPPPAPAKKAVTARPSPESRAARAVSKAKKARPTPQGGPLAGSTMPPRR